MFPSNQLRRQVHGTWILSPRDADGLIACFSTAFGFPYPLKVPCIFRRDIRGFSRTATCVVPLRITCFRQISYGGRCMAPGFPWHLDPHGTWIPMAPGSCRQDDGLRSVTVCRLTTSGSVHPRGETDLTAFSGTKVRFSPKIATLSTAFVRLSTVAESPSHYHDGLQRIQLRKNAVNSRRSGDSSAT